jgi:CheY-like chemotaxis protein
MNKGSNQPQHPGNRGRRRHRRGKGQHNQPGGGQQGMRGPGGPAGGGGQNRGRRRQGAPQFVGPMDHSYRNNQGSGNELYPQNGRYRGAGRGGPQQYVNGSAGEQTIASDAPTRVVCFIDDLFFLAKIQETARKLGVKVEFVKAEKETIDRLTSDEEQKPSLIIFDLNNANAKPLTLIPKLKSKLKKQTSIVGFLSHLQGDLKVKAQEAGCDMVVPRSAFSQNLPALLRRHGSDLQETEA